MSLLTLLAVTVLAAVLAYWTWVWFAPRAALRLDPAADQAGGYAAAATVFGSVPRKQQVAAPTGLAITLLGVVAAEAGREGYAVVQLEPKEILAVREGAEIAPGLRLAEVHPEHVVLERGGGRETLAWPQKRERPAPAGRKSRKQ